MKLLRRFLILPTLILTCLIPGFARTAGFQTGAGVYFESSPVVNGFDLCIWGLKLDMRFNALNGLFVFETPVALGFDEDIVELSLEPGMMLQQGNETLTHHAGAADHAYFIFFHDHTSVAQILFRPRGRTLKSRHRAARDLISLGYATIFD